MEIEDIIQKAADDIKKILVEEAAKIHHFPTIPLGVRNRKSESGQNYHLNNSKSLFEVQSQGLASEQPGIIVDNKRRDNYLNSEIFVMLPDGLYRLGERWFIAPDGMGKINEPPYIGNLCNLYPALHTKQEDPEYYLTYGKRAFEIINNILSA